MTGAMVTGELRATARPAQPVVPVLCDVARVLASLQDAEARVRRVLVLLRRLVPYDRCGLLVLEPGGQHRLILLPAAGPDEQARVRPGLERLLALVRENAPLDSALAFADSAASMRWQPQLAVPLVALDQVLGVLAVGRDTPEGHCEDEDLQWLSVVAAQLATYLALFQARAQERAALLRRDQAAQAAVRQRDDLLATVSHDLRSPLAAIKGWAQLLQRRAARLGTREGAWMAQRLAAIEAKATGMTAQINELLDVARLQMGRPLELELHSTDLVALARQAVAEHAHTTDQHRLIFEAAVPSLVGRWDAGRLERVLANLLSNAIKYSPHGGEIRVAVDQEQEGAVIAVRDQGMGIPAADLPLLFKRFHRAVNVAGLIAGTGLGLASARHVVESHGGTISVDSQEGAGSTFTVRLPLAGSAQATAA